MTEHRDPIAALFADAKVARGRRQKRHPAEITADRLGDHLDRWYDTTDRELRDAIGRVRDWLDSRAADDSR